MNLMFTFRFSLAQIQDVHKNSGWELSQHLLPPQMPAVFNNVCPADFTLDRNVGEKKSF